jgi:cobalt-zinc-cadmium efflux system membrane fusion protein
MRWLAFVLVGCMACHPKAEKTEKAPAPQARARRVHVDPELVNSGRIKIGRVAKRRPSGVLRLPADVVASPEGAAEAGTLLAGRIARFEVKEGDRVKPGQVLAWLDSPEAAHAVADVIRARTRSETLARKVARLQGLVASEAATALALDEAQLDLELARADLAAGRTMLASLGIGEPPATAGSGISAQLPIRSPALGTIVERTASLGAHVTPEQHLFRIVSEGRVVIEARVADSADVALDTTTPATIASHGERCKAQVVALLPQVDPSTRSRRVRLVPAEGCAAKLVPGAQVDVEVDVPAPTGDATLAVPAAAVVELKTAALVFARTPEAGTFDARPIEPGLRIGDDTTIRAGVAEGDEVVVDGAVLLKGELMRSELEGDN